MEQIYNILFENSIVENFFALVIAFYILSMFFFNPAVFLLFFTFHEERWWIIIEIIYGFINPVFYLISWQYSYDFFSMTSKSLNLLAWVSLSFYWGIRVLFPFEKRNKYIRIVSFLIVVFCFIVLSVFSIKDIIHSNLVYRGELFNCLIVLFYAIPYLILIGQLISLFSNHYWQYESRHFFFGRTRRLIYIPVLILTALFFIVLFRFGYSDQNIKNLILENKASIIKAAKEYNVEPNLIASIIYVNHKYYRSIIKSKIERPVMALWSGDSGSHIGFSKSLNISIGLCQIKPDTALTASWIYYLNKNPDTCPPNYKDYRDILRSTTFLQKNWKLKSFEDARNFDPKKFTGRTELLIDLFNNKENIRWCAYILSLYIIQWEQRDEKYSIREKPEIVATLYSLGFEKSIPKENPKANKYGNQVMEIYKSPWINSEFAT